MSQPGPFAYTWTPTPSVESRPAGVRTSQKEILQILCAYAVLTVDLFLLFSGTGLFFGTAGVPSLNASSVGLVAFAAAAALTGFVAHELAHKVVAQRRGFWAEFRLSPIGLAFSLITAYFASVLFAAPGATLVGGVNPLDRETWGRTSLAGPMTNVAFTAIFYGASAIAFLYYPSIFGWLLQLALINAWFATFNLLPFGPLDGKKVLRWNAGYWGAAIVGCGALAALSLVALRVYGSPFLGL